MAQKVYSLAFASHIKPVETKVRLFASLEDAHKAMKNAFDKYLAHIPLEKTCLCEISGMNAYITDYFGEDYDVDWTIEEQELEIDLKFN